MMIVRARLQGLVFGAITGGALYVNATRAVWESTDAIVAPLQTVRRLPSQQGGTVVGTCAQDTDHAVHSRMRESFATQWNERLRRLHEKLAPFIS